MFRLAGQGFINVSPTFVRCTTRMVVSLNFFQVNDYVVWCNAVALLSCYSYVIMTREPFIVKMETWAVDTSLAQLNQARRPPCLVHKYVTGLLCHCQGEMGGSNTEVSIVTKAIIMVSFIWASPLSLSFFFIYTRGIVSCCSVSSKKGHLLMVSVYRGDKKCVCELLSGRQR